MNVKLESTGDIVHRAVRIAGHRRITDCGIKYIQRYWETYYCDGVNCMACIAADPETWVDVYLQNPSL